MDDEEWTLGLLLEVVRETAKFLLEQRGHVAPYGVRLVGDEGQPDTYFPEDTQPEAAQADLVQAVLDEFGARLAQSPARGAALVVGVEGEGQRAFAAQIESKSTQVLALFKYWRTPDGGYLVEEPVFANRLLVESGLNWR